MKKLKIFSSLFALLVVMLFNISTTSYAVEFHDSADNLFAADLVLNKRQNVDGDAILLGETVNFSGNAKGNIIALGNTQVSIGATDFKNAFVLAKNEINIKGDCRSIYALGNSIRLNVTTNSAYLIAKTVNLSGKVDGDLTVIATQIFFDNGFTVTGNLKIESPIEPEYPEGMLKENVTFKKVEEKDQEKEISLTKKLFRLSKFLLWLAPTGLITALIYIKLLGPMKRQGVLLLKKAPLNIFLYGILMLVGLPTISFIFMVAIVGVPTALIILMIYSICFLLAVPCFGVALGEYIMPKQSDLIAGLIGTLVVSILVAVPYIGGIIYLVALLYTYGMFSILIFSLAKQEKRIQKRRARDKYTIKDVRLRLKNKINDLKEKRKAKEKDTKEDNKED